jgi:hypothetical protein
VPTIVIARDARKATAPDGRAIDNALTWITKSSPIELPRFCRGFAAALIAPRRPSG